MGVRNGDVLLYRTLQDKAGMLTPNITTLYAFSFWDLAKQGPPWWWRFQRGSPTAVCSRSGSSRKRRCAAINPSVDIEYLRSLF